ncbi:MAG: TIGR04283 family arsenosugar biosynthesis glycosyltransferase [Gammaproteobacteria bacterium]|nr:MAG: TIGR04283 family arsenosugar biosynthesis glycosyltransferase [Gammaproteobacteria bacterium]
MQLSIIIPALDEAESIIALLQQLQPLRTRGHEVILVDGGSKDETVALAEPLVDRLLITPTGRARQMNAGATVANGQILWFVHADSGIPDKADELIVKSDCNMWGRFNVHLSGDSILLRVVERLMNLRSRITGIATGDQGIFVSRTLFERIGGYADLPLMEDVDLSKRLKREQRPVCVQHTLTTSSRRWEQRGIVRTIFLMWYLRLAWSLGVPAARLATHYE